MGSLFERARQGTPIIEDDRATFVWVGDPPPQLVGDFTGWEHGQRITLTRAAPKVWVHTQVFPRDAYLEYAFWQDGERLADPLNPHAGPDGLGHHNHYFYMPGATPTSLTRRQRNVRHGTVTRHAIEDDFWLVGGRRAVDLYQPPSDQACPLVVVLDGQDYRPRAKIANIVDNLIAQERIRPIALAMIYHAGKARGVEYACSEAHLAVLMHHVLPLAQKELDLLDVEAHPGAYGILGASMGGLMALYTGLRAPHIFGHVISQSGAFTVGDHATVVWDLVEYGPVPPLRIWMDVGRYEELLACNQRMGDLLNMRGYQVTYREYNGGHNYASWRDEVWRGLARLFAADPA